MFSKSEVTDLGRNQKSLCRKFWWVCQKARRRQRRLQIVPFQLVTCQRTRI